MMTHEQYNAYVKRLALPELGLAYLARARNGADGQPAAPSRSLANRVGNVLVRYPSLKNEKVLPCESQRIEFALALVLEHDDDVLEFWTQPPAIELNYVSAHGRDVRCQTTPDFLVLRRNSVELIEAKPADAMTDLVAQRPGRYEAVETLTWRCPPGEKTATEFGFRFRLRTDAEFSRELVRNLLHLDPFLKLGANHYAEDQWHPVYECLLSSPGMSVEDLSIAAGVEGAKMVRWLMAWRLIYCDLNRYLLDDPTRARVYPNVDVARSLDAMNSEPLWPSGSPASAMDDLTKLLLTRDQQAFAIAYRRWQIVHGYIPREAWDVTAHTVRLWHIAYQKSGYLGLLPDSGKQGNRTSRVAEDIDCLANDFINTHFLKPPKKTGRCVYRMFLDACKELHPTVNAPSYVWFANKLKLLKRERVEEAQSGKRAAYPFQFNEKSLLGLWDSRGDFPFMVCHCDHTQLDVQLVSERTGQLLGKPWMTVLFDATCRAVLAIYVSFDSPSRDSLMMILRDCVERHGRLPFGMLVDNAAEFRSTYFQTLTGSRGMIVKQRPPHHAKYGNPVENFFGVLNTEFLHVLEGSNLILQTSRIATKSVDPRNRAVWTIALLYAAIEYYCFELFNKRDHKDLGKSPARALTDLMAKHGIDQMPKQAFDNDFLIQTMPEVGAGTVRVQAPCFVQVHNEEFHNPQLAGALGKNLPARWDPMDPSRVLVELPTGWVECVSKYRKEVSGMTVRDVKFFAQEQRQRHQATAQSRRESDLEHGQFLRHIKEDTEPELVRLRDAARESHRLNAQLAGGSVEPATPATPPKAETPVVPKIEQELPTGGLRPRRKANLI